MAQGGGMRARYLRVRGSVGDGVAELRLEGELELGSSHAVRDAVRDALDDGARDVLLDLRPLTLLDSTGLNALLNTARDVRRRGARLRSVSPRGSAPRMVIDLAGVEGLLGIEDAG